MDAGATLGIGAAIAALIAILKQAFPALPSRTIPLLVLALSAALIGAGVASGAVKGTIFDIILIWIGQAAATLGVREGVVTAVPSASNFGSQKAAPVEKPDVPYGPTA